MNHVSGTEHERDCTAEAESMTAHEDRAVCREALPEALNDVPDVAEGDGDGGDDDGDATFHIGAGAVVEMAKARTGSEST